MTWLIWRLQAWLWSRWARPIPTCFLQAELTRRPGVESWRVQIGQSRPVLADGPCVVTVNRD